MCPLCPQNNLLKEPILAETSNAYLMPAHGSPGIFLITPKQHVELPGELPPNWWSNMAELLAKVPKLGEHYNISLNFGKDSGQTIKHLHFWVIPRAAGQPASGKGLAGLISEVNG